MYKDMKKLPTLKFTELWPLMHLGHNLDLNGTIVDDASLEVMLRIEQTMQRLKPMGDDEQRTLWIQMKAPGERNRWERADENGIYWYLLTTARYKDFHYLAMRNRSFSYFDLRNKESVHGERKPDIYRGNVSVPLHKIELYIKKLVDNICENSDWYNSYIEEHLPYFKRDGEIRRSDLNRICPEYRTFNNPKETLNLLNNYKQLPLSTFPKMTLRTYMHLWRILYVAYRILDDFEPDPPEAFQDLPDEEIFREHNSKGDEIEGLDLDSEEDFKKWEDENSSYHCHDVAYARIHLAACKKGKRWGKEPDIPDGQWYFSLWYDVYGYTRDFVNLIQALSDEGIGVECNPIPRLIRMAEESDWVGISPIPDEYVNNEHIGNEIRLPHVDEDTTPEQVQAVIDATHWYPLEKVELNTRE